MTKTDSADQPTTGPLPKEGAAATEAEAKAKKIMIVEDEGIVAMQIKSLLTDLGYAMLPVVARGEDALTAALAATPDLILMDIRLAGHMTGIEAAALIKKAMDVPVIYLTAHADEKSIEQAKLTEPSGYLIKPLNSLALNSAVEMALYKHDADVKRRRAEEEIQKSKEAWVQTFDAMDDLIMIVDSEYRITRANKAFINKFDLPFSEVLGKRCFKLLHNMDAPPPSCLLNKMQSVKQGISEELRIGDRSYIVSVSPILGPNGELTGAVHAAKDITERKKLEEELKGKTLLLEEMNEELQKAALEQYRHRVEKEQMLIQQSKLAAMGEMIGAIAHQWRQPLNSLGLIVQSLKDVYECGELDAVYLDKTVNNAMMQINFMSRTIDDFRNFINPSKQKSSFDIKVAVGEIFSLLSSQMKNNFISYALTCHVHNKTFRDFREVETCGDFDMESFKNEFKHVILNLVINAKDAILERRRKGEMDNAEKGMISADFYRDHNKIIMTLTDNGGGIPDGLMDRIFEPYYTTKGEGTGIGLYMSKTIIEQNMGGKLTVRNINGGAEFRMELSL